ncbi:MAG: replication restart helicase PriA [Saccharofermentanales bacterium]|jgi:primosomal protein N' (replication factor Y)|nr:primosomal protein N' [Bacillota bacterium]NLB09212.1 primosomal protein N' [Clostridiales bacterium]
MYAEVWLEEATRQFDRDWTYLVPPALADQIKPGCLVEVPFARRKQTVRGYIYRIVATPPADLGEIELRSISGLVNPRPLVTPELLELAREMRRRYFCSRGRAVRTMVPYVVTTVGDKKELAARLTDPDCVVEMLAADEFRSLGHIRVAEFLLLQESATLSEIEQACQVSYSILNYLQKKGVLTFFPQVTRRELSVGPELELEEQEIVLTKEQADAVDSISAALTGAQTGQLQEFLLQGVTGSGKTEVYLQAADRVLEQGKTVLILVPEIALTPLMVARVSARFDQQAAILHSRLTPAERYETWQRILAGEKKIVVGARSAVFAPLTDLGLIVVDEEQDQSYKSETSPRYHALDMARIRSLLAGAVLVLGSATPAVETCYRVREGRSTRLILPKRVGEAGMAQVGIVDLRAERAAGHKHLFSRPLIRALQETFERSEQAMLLINRRGFANAVYCCDCGASVECPDCDIALTSHKNPWQSGREHLICHYCGKIFPLPKFCAECHGTDLDTIGAGTQQAETLFRELFPSTSAIRMDLDTTSGRYSHQEILSAFARHEYDCLIGTQMIAKGHDFHNVTLVGILSADQMLAQSNYRAGEHTFQLLTQAAGRAGRGNLPGQVIIQTAQPDDQIIRAAAGQDYDNFFDHELAFRSRAGYPPFAHLGLIMLSGRSEAAVEEQLNNLYDYLCRQIARYPGNFDSLELLPGQRAPLSRLRGRYRFRLIARSPSKEAITLLLRTADNYRKRPGIATILDINPYSML